MFDLVKHAGPFLPHHQAALLTTAEAAAVAQARWVTLAWLRMSPGMHGPLGCGPSAYTRPKTKVGARALRHYAA
jgi:hypothetical protein